MNTKKQQGSAHVIIIVVLVVALIAALGVVFYQNFINKKDKNTTNNTSTSATVPKDDTSPTPAPADNTTHLTIADWGVQFDAPTDGTTITYATWNDGGVDPNTIGFSSKDVEAFGGDLCQADRGPLGVITRSKDHSVPITGTNVDLNDGQPINGYYYVYSEPQGGCSDADTGGVQTSQTKTVEIMAKTIRAE